MATFTNQAQLLYNDTVINSNVAVGEVTEVLSASKTSLTGTYTAENDVTYVISLNNSGASALTGVTVTDDLGAYDFDQATLYPLTYVDGSGKAFVNGALQTMTVNATETSVVFSGITVPAGGSVLIVYEAAVNAYAPVDAGGTITNTATVTAPSITAPVTASATLNAATAPLLSIVKSIDPIPVTENGQISFSISVMNNGNTEVPSTGNAVISDTLNPALTGLTATLDGEPMTSGTDYTYDEATGAFSTTEGTISVPAATFTQNADGTWTVTPGVTTLVITGTV